MTPENQPISVFPRVKAFKKNECEQEGSPQLQRAETMRAEKENLA